MSCLGCSSGAVRHLVDFGSQPPSNRFEMPGAAAADAHPLTIGQCGNCGLVQLVAPMPTAMVKPRVDWLTYNEPEGHLDDLVGRLTQLPGIDATARIIGVTYKDDTTIERFAGLGYADTYRLSPSDDLRLAGSSAGLEAIQAALDPPMARTLAQRHGPADLLLVRHILEHAHDPQAFLTSLRTLVRPGGYLFFEVPDCTKFLQACDYSFVWEEHITYFSPVTLEGLVGRVALTPEWINVYPYPLEDSLVAIFRNDPPAAGTAATTPAAVRQVGADFAQRFAPTREHLQTLLGTWKRDGKRIAVFGAGHLAVKFLNLLSVSDLVECVIDDHPEKQRVLMPGSRLPIRGSETLADIDICLLALNSESEQKVLAKHQSFTDRGGAFYSIFALHPQSVYRTVE